MKEYIRTGKEVLAVHKTEPLHYGLAALCGALVGIIMVVVIVSLEGTGQDYGELGGFMSLLFGIAYFLIVGVFGDYNNFNLAICMGKTRKAYLPIRYVIHVLNVAIVLVIHGLVSIVENALYSTLYPDAVCEMHIQLGSNPILCIVILMLLPMAGLLGNVLFMRFGAKFAWIIWALWMLGCIGFARFADSVEGQSEMVNGQSQSTLEQMASTIGGFFDRIGSVGTLAIAFAVTALGLTAARLLYRKQRVTL